MIVFDLRCEGGHVFEAWFGSSEDFDDQQRRGLLSCPLCGDGAIAKAVMAPAVATKGNRAVDPGPAAVKAAMRRLAEKQAEALKCSQWVGSAFADRARAMHDGEEPHATIHGRATPAEAKALIEDGVPVTPLPLPIFEPGARH